MSEVRAGLYARVSQAEQAEGYSIDQQVDAMRRFCVDRGWTISAEYVDPGYSGTVRDRPAFTRAIQDCEAGKLDILLTHQLDRFYRNLQLQLETLGQLGRWGVGYLSVTEQIDYSTPQGRLFLSMLGAFNEYYVANLRREVRKGKLGRAKNGLTNASIPAHGYRYDGEKAPLAIDDHTSRAVIRAFEEYASGEYSDQQIADLLNREGFAPCGHKADRWIAPTVRYMLMNRFYVGEVKHGRAWLPGQHQAIIDPDLFEQAQAARRRRRFGARAGRHVSGVYLLHGTGRCRECGQPLHMNSGRNFEYYLDSARRRGLDCPAAGRGVGMAIIDDQVGEVVRRLRLPADWRARLSDLAQERPDQVELDGQRRYLEEKRRRLRDLYVEGDFSKTEYGRRKAEFEGQIAGLRQADLPDVDGAGVVFESMGERWEGWSKEMRRDVLKAIFEAIYIDILGRRVVCVKPWPPFAPLFRMDGLEERESCFYVQEAGSES